MLSPKEKKRFEKLIQKYLAGRASSREAAFVESYYGQFDGKELDASLQGDEQRVIEDRLLEALKDRMDAPGAVVPLYRKPGLRVAAAAAILLLAAGTWWYHGKTTDNRMIAAQARKADVSPGGDKATLTLANGRTIILDSASIGNLAQQGYASVVKLAGGQVAYVPRAGRGGKAGDAGQAGNEGQAGGPAGEDHTLYNTLTTPIGGQYKITLPDGTRVWLNSASSIRYPTAFTGGERRVEITGEAYFEVKGNAHMPFAVDAGGVAIQVLGTHFNVMAYSDEASINTTLVEGKVKVVSDKGAAILQLGQQALVGNSLSHIVVKEVDTDKETAWINGFFEFDQTDLPTLMRQLKRWYGIEPVYQSNENNRLFGGRINRNLNLSEVLNLLQSNGIHFKIEGKKLVVLE